jgi:hypothetical protein
MMSVLACHTTVLITLVGPILGLHPVGRLLSLFANTLLGQKLLAVTYTLAYYSLHTKVLLYRPHQ